MANTLIFRYPPNCRFINGSFKKQKEVTIKKEVFGDSITDKESYRLNLSAKRGQITSLNGSVQKGMYMFDDGKYDLNKDFSYILIKDLSLVEIDDYLHNMEDSLKSADDALRESILSQLQQLKDKKENLVLQNKETNSGSSE